MNSYRRTRSRAPLLGVLIAISIVVGGVFVLDAVTHGTLRSYTRTSSSIVFSGAVGALDIFRGHGGISTRAQLARENEALRRELQMRTEEVARAQAISDENETLRALLALKEDEGDGIAARVLSSYRTSPYGTFTIDAGKGDGVQVGDVVVTPGGFVLGTVTALDSFTATVESVFAPGKETDFLVGAIAFTGVGRGGGNTRAEIPRDAVVREGDVARVPAYGGRVAGLVGHIEVASSSATQTLFIRIPSNLSTLTFVYVLPR